MKKIVNVISVEFDIDKDKRDGGVYKATVFKYTDAGEEREIALASAFMKSQPILLGELQKLKAGQDVEITLEKRGMYWNLTEVDGVAGNGESAAAPSSRSPAPRSTYVDNSIGMQVGNALSNAALLLAHGQIKGTLEEAARHVIQVGETLKAAIVAGEFEGTSRAPAKGTKLVDEDIPFGD